jgi:uncharacterized protein (DUF924 family)
MPVDSQSIIDFWFSERVRPLWFNSTPEFDEELRKQYADLYQDAKADKLKGWEDSAEGCLALVIILDQFPLNMFRGQPESFATEAKAVHVARQAVTQGLDMQLESQYRVFLYMPFMHSENMADQDLAVELFDKSGLSNNLRFAHHHRDIVRRFGRFPHRNVILGRQSTAQELAYLASDEAFHG